jgi:hypothetical protein
MHPGDSVTVRGYFDAYTAGDPGKFDDVVADDYTDYGHNPPGRGPQGARDDGNVAVAWTGTLPNGKQSKGLSLYLVKDGKITEIRHAAIGALPA